MIYSPALLEPKTVSWIEHVCEPRRLILAWQAPDHFKNRFRWAVGELARSDSDFVFRYFDHGKEFEELNQGHSP